MKQEKIIFFDGVCNLCNQSVLFILKRDKKEKFLFSSLQSKIAKESLKDKYDCSKMNSIVLLDNGKVYDKSSAILKIAKELSFPWKLVFLFIIVPKPIRNNCYLFISKRRYRWFGKKESCMIPSEKIKKRFL